MHDFLFCSLMVLQIPAQAVARQKLSEEQLEKKCEMKREMKRTESRRAREIYQESVMAEGMGQVDDARARWHKILNFGPGNPYYEKASHKLCIYEDEHC